MSKKRRIVIEAEPREQLTVSLVGHEYLIRPLKGAMGIEFARQAKDVGEDAVKAGEMVDDLIKLMFSKKDQPKITKRLNDPEDDLDITHIMQIVQAVAEATTDDTPTT